VPSTFTSYWADDDVSSRVFDYDKLSFPFEQFDPSTVFGSIADVAAGQSPLFRNIVAPELAASVQEQAPQVWTRKTADGLGRRSPLVQRSYDLQPKTLAPAPLTERSHVVTSWQVVRTRDQSPRRER
jgi:hypothetical protein